MRALLRVLYGNTMVLANAGGQRGFPWRPAGDVARARDRRVRRMVRHAAKHVPYYSEAFRRLGLDPRDLRTARDLARLPILEKAVVRADPEAFVARTFAGRRAVRFETSGTGGEPLPVFHDIASLLANIAYGEREREVFHLGANDRGPTRVLVIAYPTSTGSRVQRLYDEWTWIPQRPSRRFLSVREPLETIVATLDAFRPHVVSAYGGYLEALFRTLTATGTVFHRPDAVLYGAEGVTPEGKSLIEQELGVPVYSQYNAVEAFKIGFTCERRSGFHVHDDLCPVRLVDGDGREVPDGDPGSVVISNLVNRATVLLNYRLGDVAVRSPSPCPCGRGLSLLSEIRGRIEDVLWLSADRFVHPRAVWEVLKGSDGLLRFRLQQHAADRYTLELSTSSPERFDAIAASAVPRLRALLGGASVEPVAVEELGLHDERKFRAVVARARPNGVSFE